METDFNLARRARSWIVLYLLLAPLLLSASSGCALVGSRNRWDPPPLFSPTDSFAPATANLASAEAQYTAGQQAEAAGNPACIDYYFAAATQSWPYHVAGAEVPNDHATELYPNFPNV